MKKSNRCPHLVLFLLFTVLTLCSNCGTTVRSHPYVDFSHMKSRQSAEVADFKTIESDDPADTCALLAMPGDFVLSHMSGSGLGKAAYQPFLLPIMLLELLDLNDPFTKYFHAEIITRIDSDLKIRTRGFYPFSKRYIANMFHDNYAIFRVRGYPEKQEEALQKIASKDYPGFGVCSDFIAWAYSGRIYSWWNCIPYLRDVLVRVYPPEALHTSDNLANSPQTVKICEVRNGKIVYPEKISTALLLNHLDKCGASTVTEIRDHAEQVKKVLRLFSYIDSKDKLLINQILLSDPHIAEMKTSE